MSRIAAHLKHTACSASSTTTAIDGALRSLSICHRQPYQSTQEEGAGRRRCYNNSTREAVARGKRPVRSFEDLFVNALVAAGQCSQHRIYIAPSSRTQRPQLRQPDAPRRSIQSRSFSSRPPKEQTALATAPKPDVSKDDYEHLVNTYPSFPSANPETPAVKHERDQDWKHHYPLAPRLVLTPVQELSAPDAVREVLEPQDLDQAMRIHKLEQWVTGGELGYVSQDKLWDLYLDVPTPRPRYLSDHTIHRLFRHLAWVEIKTRERIQRFHALLDECLAERVHLNHRVWNTAIVFTGKWYATATDDDVKVAIETWMRMEDHGHKASHDTFNILFRAAVNAGRFALADTIFSELKARNLPLDRYWRCNLMYYAGVRRDGDGVRQAFRDLVNAGEIVDTSIMNKVIHALLQAGEAPAAENVFIRMKSLHEQKFGTSAPREWQIKKTLTRLLMRTSEQLRNQKQVHESSFFGGKFSSEDQREAVQKASPIAPDSLTYQMLIKHHAYTSGDIDKTLELLAEMKANDMDVPTSLYVHLLRGFKIHGGYAYSAWNRRILEELWRELVARFDVPKKALGTSTRKHESDEISEDQNSDMLGAMMAEQSRAGTPTAKTDTEAAEDVPDHVPNQDRPHRPQRAFAIAAVEAFYKCSGRKRMLEVWEEVLTMWTDQRESDKQVVQEKVDRMVADDSIYID